MDKKFMGDKEIISRCSNCPDFLSGNEIIKTESELVEISEKLDNDLAVISHGICNSCLLELYPDYFHE